MLVLLLLLLAGGADATARLRDGTGWVPRSRRPRRTRAFGGGAVVVVDGPQRAS